MKMASLVESCVEAGVWTAVVDGDGSGLAVVHEGRVLQGLSAEPCGEGQTRLRLPLPVELIGGGPRALSLAQGGASAPVAHIIIFAGPPDAGDLAAEVAMLRAELDMLRAAFRRMHAGAAKA